MIFQEAKDLFLLTHFWTGDVWMFCPGCAAPQPCCSKQDIKMEARAGPFPCNPSLLGSSSESLQLVSVCASGQPRGPAPRPGGGVAMSWLCLMNETCKRTHLLQMLLYTTPRTWRGVLTQCSSDLPAQCWWSLVRLSCAPEVSQKSCKAKYLLVSPGG